MIPWWEDEWCIYDLETTGVEPESCHIVQIAMVRMKGGVVTAKSSGLVNPGIPIPAEATAIHGITDAMVADARPEREIAMKAAQYLAAYPGPIVGYNNFGYDDRVLTRIAGTTWNHPRAVDVLTIVRTNQVGRWWRGAGRHKMIAVAERLGIEPPEGGYHEATADCIQTGKILWTLATGKDYGAEVRKLLPAHEPTAGTLKALAAEHEADFQRWLARQVDRIVDETPIGGVVQ